jgi:hypothetical protein
MQLAHDELQLEQILLSILLYFKAGQFTTHVVPLKNVEFMHEVHVVANVEPYNVKNFNLQVAQGLVQFVQFY